MVFDFDQNEEIKSQLPLELSTSGCRGDIPPLPRDAPPKTNKLKPDVIHSS